MSFYELAEKAMELERQGKKIIRLNIGDTNLPTDPRIVDGAIKSLKEGKAKYGPAAGLAELRKKIAEKEGCEVENIVVGPSSKYLLFALMSTLADKGDKIVLPTPTWPAYEMVCRQLGLEAVKIETKMEDNWSFGNLPLDNAKIAIICNPVNPTSTIHKEEDINAAVKDAKEKGVYLILDEAYKDIAFTDIPKHDDAIRVRSFSKEFNMEGWRIGYVVAPKEVADKLRPFIQITTTCVPSFIQKAAVSAIENEDEIRENNLKIWKDRVEFVSDALSEAGFRFSKPGAGIYFFLTHERMPDTDKWALDLLDKGVALSPGSAFGPYKRFVRICANQPNEVIKEAISIMAKALD